MKLIKFYIQKNKENYKEIQTSEIKDWFDFKVVGIFGYFKHKKNGWRLNDVEYLFFTKFNRYWSELSTSNKIAIIGIAIAIVVSVILFSVDKIYF
jgi:ABC-type phosphate/phosphonate transport system permease subunit